MQLPEQLHQRHFSDWNYLVRGLVEIWDLFHMVGLEEELEQHLTLDQDGMLTEMLGRIGNDCSTLASILSVHSTVLAARTGLPAFRCGATVGRGTEGDLQTESLSQLGELIGKLDQKLACDGPLEPKGAIRPGQFLTAVGTPVELGRSPQAISPRAP